MEELPGAFGSSASFALRLGQTVFSTASLLLMCLDVDFSGYSAFSYLVTVMGLVIPWSITLLVADAYSVFIKCLPYQRRLILIILLGDMILSYLSLAAACSTASVTDLLLDADGSYCPSKLCGVWMYVQNPLNVGLLKLPLVAFELHTQQGSGAASDSDPG